jgi:hypothetical protein
MSEHFLHFKKAFHQSVPQMKFPTFSKPINHFGSIQYSKWMKLFSTGIIVYSAYFYLKRTSKYNEVQHSFFSYLNCVKKLFSRTREKETQKNIELKVKELPEHVKYDGGWFDELDELKRTSSSEEPAIFRKDGYSHSLLDPLRETTPRGEIVMYYDTEPKSFNYYSNSKNIPYSTLDAVARKYVCLHKDPSIYIDIRDEVEKGREKCLKQDKDNKSNLERNKNKIGNEFLSSAKKSLFAAFKNYKTGRNVSKSLHKNDEKKEMTVVMKDNVNKFVYKGTLDQYNFDVNYYKNKKHSCQTNTNENVGAGAGVETIENKDKNLSYADFKKNLIN